MEASAPLRDRVRASLLRPIRTATLRRATALLLTLC
jgi:hypothetical protein